MAPHDPHAVGSVEELHRIFGAPSPRALTKETTALDARQAGFVARAPFALLGTAGSDGSCDVSPRGGEPGFIRVLDDRLVALPEFGGNRRFDGVRNVLERPGAALLVLVPGLAETLRIAGDARLTRDPDLLAAGATADGRQPWFVLLLAVRQVFGQCGKAVLRSGLWDPATWPDPSTVPTVSRSVADLAERDGMGLRAARARVEDGYRPELY